MNSKKVPQLFVATGATKWNDPKGNPWTMGWQPNYQSEGRIYAEYLMKNHPNGKIGILYQNDDYGKDYVKGLKDGLNGKMQIVSELPYEPADPTVDSQIINLKASGADVFFNVTTPKFAAQAIKKAHEIGWKPVHLLNNVSNSVGSVIKPAGLEASKGVLSTGYLKDPTDPTWDNDAGKKEWVAFMDKYYPEGDKTSSFTAYGYTVAQSLVAGAQAVRRRPHPRQRDEAGREPEEPDASDAAARHHDQHQRRGLRSDQADADAEVQRRALGAVRPDHDAASVRGAERVSALAVPPRRSRAQASGGGHSHGAPAPQGAGAFVSSSPSTPATRSARRSTTSSVTAIGRV